MRAETLARVLGDFRPRSCPKAAWAEIIADRLEEAGFAAPEATAGEVVAALEDAIRAVQSGKLERWEGESTYTGHIETGRVIRWESAIRSHWNSAIRAQTESAPAVTPDVDRALRRLDHDLAVLTEQDDGEVVPRDSTIMDVGDLRCLHGFLIKIMRAVPASSPDVEAALKARISEVLRMALAGTHYRTTAGFTQWGLVESDLLASVSHALAPTPSPEETNDV